MNITRPESRKAPGSGAVWRRHWKKAAWLVGLVLLAVVLLLARLGFGPLEAFQLARNSQPIEIIRYAEYRLLGHPVLEALLLPALQAARRQIEREPPATLADLGKGQQAEGLLPQFYDGEGVPEPMQKAPGASTLQANDGPLTTTEALVGAIGRAEAGEVIELAPGSYRITSTLVTGHPGTAARPITLRARRPGTVTLQVAVEQGIIVNQPYWIFENLNWRGACSPASGCEHAFHVVGPARGTVIRNNLIEDFNGHIRVNGERNQWPDAGLLQYSTLRNAGPRTDDHRAAPFDLVGASGWQVVDNVVEHFVKTGSNGISYGIFMKGGGTHGRIERNLVVCTPRDISQPGIRVGISFGDGGTGAADCRSPGCRTEHSDGVIANNVVAHCNDAGIDVFRSERIVVAHNTLVNTRGILVREEPAEAQVVGNLLEGAIRERRGGRVREVDNRVESSLDNALVAPDALDLRWRDLPPTLPRLAAIPRDFCGRDRPLANPPGATLSPRCTNTPNEAAAR